MESPSIPPSIEYSPDFEVWIKELETETDSAVIGKQLDAVMHYGKHPWFVMAADYAARLHPEVARQLCAEFLARPDVQRNLAHPRLQRIWAQVVAERNRIERPD